MPRTHARAHRRVEVVRSLRRAQQLGLDAHGIIEQAP
jgi:hypothetical protein